MTNFEKKFKDKSGLKWASRMDTPKSGKYTFIERNYDEDDSDAEEDIKAEDDVKEEEEEEYVPPVSQLPTQQQELMALIFNQAYLDNSMSALNYDANKLPLGKLSKSTILRGFQALKDLAALFDDHNLATSAHGMPYGTAVETLSNRFYSIIPHAFGRNRPPIIATEAMLKKEIELLESLGDMKEAAAIMKANRPKDTVHQYDRQFASLNMEEMTALDTASDEFTNLAEYLIQTKGETHNVKYRVEEIFRIERAGEKQRFEESEYAKIASDRRLLWHGSRTTNFGGILSQGLRIAPPEAPVSGYMFGKVGSLLHHLTPGHLPRGHVEQIGQLLLRVQFRRDGAPSSLRGGARRTDAAAHAGVIHCRRQRQEQGLAFHLGAGNGRPVRVEGRRVRPPVAEGD